MKKIAIITVIFFVLTSLMNISCLASPGDITVKRIDLTTSVHYVNNSAIATYTEHHGVYFDREKLNIIRNRGFMCFDLTEVSAINDIDFNIAFDSQIVDRGS